MPRRRIVIDNTARRLVTAAGLDDAVVECDLASDLLHLAHDMAAHEEDGRIDGKERRHEREHLRQIAERNRQSYDLTRRMNRANEAIETGHPEQVPAILAATQL